VLDSGAGDTKDDVLLAQLAGVNIFFNFRGVYTKSDPQAQSRVIISGGTLACLAVPIMRSRLGLRSCSFSCAENRRVIHCIRVFLHECTNWWCMGFV
jgi:hypothetical protein